MLTKGFDRDVFVALRDHGALIAKGLANSQHKKLSDFFDEIIHHNQEATDNIFSIPTALKIEKVYQQAADLKNNEATLSSAEKTQLDSIFSKLWLVRCNWDQAIDSAMGSFSDAKEMKLGLALFEVFSRDPNSSLLEDYSNALKQVESGDMADPAKNQTSSKDGGTEQSKKQCIQWMLMFRNSEFFQNKMNTIQPVDLKP